MSVDQKKSEQKKIIVLLLSLTGVVLALILLSHHYGGELFCSSGGGCDTVAKSVYSSLFGIPLALIGYIYFSLLLLLAADSFFQKNKSFTHAATLFLFSTLGVIADVFLFFTMVLVIESFCWLCFLTYLVNIFVLFFSYSEVKDQTKTFGSFRKTIQENFLYFGQQRKRSSVLGVIFLLLAVSGIFANKFFVSANGLNLNAQDTKDLEAVWQKFFTDYKNAPTVQLTSTVSYNNEKGNKKAPLVIVEFSDFLCPYCKVASGYLKEINEAFPQDVLIIHQNFPLDKVCNFSMQRQLHEGSCLLSKAAICAGNQNTFWQMYFLIFANQDRWSRFGVRSDDVTQMAKLLNEKDNANINLNDFQQCLNENKSLRIMQNEIQHAVDLNINATPTLFFNGKQISSFPNFYILKRLINYEKEKTKNEK